MTRLEAGQADIIPLTMLERLQKILAQAGYGSRRACEDFITAGRVRVNGKLAELGQKADPAVDKITVDGKPIAAAEALVYIALHKPRNVLSTVEAEAGDGRRTVRDLVDVTGSIHPVGRLDYESEGILLWADDFGPSSQNVDEIYSYPVDIIPDQDGNIYVLSDSNARWVNPIRDFSGDWDGVLAKYDNNGELLWNTFLGGPAEDGLSAVGIDQDGNIYVSGGGQTTGGNPLSPHTGTSAGFMAKLDPNGDLLWNTFIGSETGIVGINTFMVEEDGTLYLAGTSTTTWGNPFDAFAGNADGYIAQMDSNGSLLWNTFIGGSGNESIGYLAISNNQ
jgi:hypothetical protein